MLKIVSQVLQKSNESNQDCSQRERRGCRMLWLHTWNLFLLGMVVILLLHCALQKLVKKLLTPGSILVGHNLNHALAILKVDNKQVIDTGLLFHNSGSHTGPLPTIVNLCKDSRRKD